ncbi:DUF222 domain-containing protein [Rhodococcus sp. ARC_M6]|uniref:DUF222 domain-containing protein n=1 Tax=Rhodococcus sp. ARC_M6 TaxID=2928852 RepID=UPI001FB2C97D|nr:DUF222 domain-containing protein [Rhodococcus sp. ARC_M6]MCJ0902215.1 13E12 repeat family protein [Rhodococcus sp. ARC_M6]
MYGRVSVKGDLEAVNGARLIALLSGLAKPTPEIDGVKDARTPALRRADGFCEMLRRFEMAGLGPVEGGVKPHLTITATAKDLTDLQALKGLLPSTEELGYAITNWAGPVSLDSARMLACDLGCGPTDFGSLMPSECRDRGRSENPVLSADVGGSVSGSDTGEQSADSSLNNRIRDVHTGEERCLGVRAAFTSSAQNHQCDNGVLLRT